MKRLLTFFFLLFVSGLALADSSKHSSILSPDAINNYTDMSVYYLTQIFGTVGKVLGGNSSQMMGHLFYTLNYGILIVSGIIISYAVVFSVVRIATEGVTNHQGRSTVFVLLKLAFGVALIVPNGATGYSVLQDIVMKVVVEGVGLADSVWDNGLKYLKEGGAVWSMPQDTGPSNQGANYHYAVVTNTTNTDPLFKDNTDLAPTIFQAEVCMLGSRDNGAMKYYNYFPDTRTIDGVKRQQFNFPGLSDTKMSTTTPSCGYVSWDVNGACRSDENSTQCQTARASVLNLINALMPAAKKYYCSKAQGDVKQNGICRAFSDSTSYPAYLFDAAMSYLPNIKANADMAASNNQDSSKRFIDGAMKEGWIMAGRYYWDIMQLTKNTNSASDLSNYSSVSGMHADKGSSDTAWFNKAISLAADKLTSYYPSAYQKYFADVYDASAANSGAETDKIKEKKNIIGSGNLVSSNKFAGITAGTAIVPGVMATFDTMMSGMNEIGHMFRDVTSHNFNPIQFLYSLGQKCIEITTNIWIVGAVLISANLMVGAICAASNPYFAGASAIVDWVKPIFMLVATAFWGAGFFLSFYIPIYPYMIFLFAVIGWFISVIESMVAAPLVALGLAHPENHDLLGKAEQAVMLLLGVFIQPALLVVGMIGGIIFSYVTFDMLIYTFSAFITDIFTWGGSSSTPIFGVSHNILAAAQNSHLYMDTGILVQPLLLVVFCTIMYTLLTQSFSLVYLLRDNVMKWIGAPTSGLPNPEQLTGDTKGAIQSYGKQTGQAMGEFANNHKAMMGAPAAVGGSAQFAGEAGGGSDSFSMGQGSGNSGGAPQVSPEMAAAL